MLLGFTYLLILLLTTAFSSSSYRLPHWPETACYLKWFVIRSLFPTIIHPILLSKRNYLLNKYYLPQETLFLAG